MKQRQTTPCFVFHFIFFKYPAAFSILYVCALKGQVFRIQLKETKKESE